LSVRNANRVVGESLALPIGAIQDFFVSATVVSQMRIDLTWNAMPGGQSGYVVERATGTGVYTQVATVPANTTAWSNSGLTSRTTYQYRVRPIGAIGLFGLTQPATTLAYDAGLNSAFLSPTPSSGAVRNILSYGATSNNSSNDDSTAIRNAIAASSAGDQVYIPNGTFHLKTRDIRLKTGVSIVGQSMTGAILAAQFTDAGTENPNSQVFRADPGVNNLTLQNFRVQMGTGQSMEYALYLGSGSSGVSNVSRIAVRNLSVEGFEKFAIALRNCDNILVQGCDVKNATALGGGGQGYCVMIGYDNSRNNWITGNTFGPTIRHAVVVQYRAHHNLIENNVADGATLDAYDMHGEDEYSNEIRYNIARNCGGFGIGIGNTGSTHANSGPYNWVHNNEVFESRGGVNVILGSDDQIIEDNNFHNNTEEGILVNNGGGRRAWILRNMLRFNGTGARIEDAPDLWMEGNSITDNSSYGLRIGATTILYTIRGNDFRFNGAPILLDSTDGLFVDNLL
jgi:hypothetical protein